jgi:hypothetical protein
MNNVDRSAKCSSDYLREGSFLLLNSKEAFMTEPIITCPNCKTEIKLTESLAAPLIESTRLEYEKRLAQKDTDIAKRETLLREREVALLKAQESIDDQVAEKLRYERTKIAADEAKKVKLALATDLDQKAREIADLQEVLRQRDEKLAEAKKTQAELLKRQRELDDAKRELDLTVEKVIGKASLLFASKLRKRLRNNSNLR